MKIIQKNEAGAATPLEGLAAAIEADKTLKPEGGDAGQDGQAQADAVQADKAMALIEAGMQSVVLAVLKLGRAWVAKRLPEIREEWTDDALRAPAEAAVPLLRKRVETLMQIAGSSPEAAALAMTCIPLVMGVVTAMDKAGEREKRETQAKPVEVVGNAVPL